MVNTDTVQYDKFVVQVVKALYCIGCFKAVFHLQIDMMTFLARCSTIQPAGLMQF